MTQNIHKTMRVFGAKLIKIGGGFVRSSFKLQPKQYGKTFVRNFLADKIGISASSISLSDEKYFVIDWDKWLEMIDIDFIDDMIYKTDVFDCDNYSLLFLARAAELYNINSAGVAFGSIYDRASGKYIGRHSFQMILATKQGEIQLYLYEPMNAEWTLWEKNQNNYVKFWKYSPDWLFFA